MVTRAYTDALEKALGRVISEARREVETIRAQCAALVAEAQARATEAEARVRVAEADAERRIEDAIAAIPAPRDGRDADPEAIRAMVREAVASAVASLPPAKDGKDADPDAVRSIVAELVAEAVAELPPAKDGRDADPQDVRRMVQEAVAQIPAPRDGRDADPEAVRAMVSEAVAEAVAALPVPQDGKDADPDEIRRMVEEAVAAIPKPKDGKLPICRAWEDRVYFEGECVTRDGALWQASATTGKAPPHADWTCLAAAGRDGLGFRHRGTWSAEVDYAERDVVMANGSSWLARHDAPGPCPGDGWALFAARGSNAKPPQVRIPPPVTLRGASLSEDAVLSLDMSDGRAVTVDFYPILSRLQK